MSLKNLVGNNFMVAESMKPCSNSMAFRADSVSYVVLG